MNKPIYFRVAGESGTSSGMVLDISTGGLLLQSFKDISVGLQILIAVKSQKGVNSGNSWAACEIVRKDIYLWDDWEAYQYGVKFIRAS